MTRGMQHSWRRREMHTKFCTENMKGKEELGDLRVDGRIIVKYILKHRLC